MSSKKLRVTTLTPIEKEAVINHYKFGIRSTGSISYTASLQLFITQSFNKIESADNSYSTSDFKITGLTFDKSEAQSKHIPGSFQCCRV